VRGRGTSRVRKGQDCNDDITTTAVDAHLVAGADEISELTTVDVEAVELLASYVCACPNIHCCNDEQCEERET
jgi:hypothetical protein